MVAVVVTYRQVMDLCSRPLGITLPTVLEMSGWSDTGENMFKDMRDNRGCGNGKTKKVLILKWEMNALSAAVSSDLKVYKFAGNRPDGKKYILRQTEVSSLPFSISIL